jgi:hypothetical protein
MDLSNPINMGLLLAIGSGERSGYVGTCGGNRGRAAKSQTNRQNRDPKGIHGPLLVVRREGVRILPSKKGTAVPTTWHTDTQRLYRAYTGNSGGNIKAGRQSGVSATAQSFCDSVRPTQSRGP